jgi:hypothetical protein
MIKIKTKKNYKNKKKSSFYNAEEKDRIKSLSKYCGMIMKR